jgi:acetyl-CoA acetyltransferase
MINTLDSKMDVAIVSAKRTPIGSLLGNLSAVSAPELGSKKNNKNKKK